MRTFRALGMVATAGMVLLSGTSTWADDTEVFFGNVPSGAGAPNILLILDTSGSMSEEVSSTRQPYDPSQTYSVSGCSSSNVYYAAASSSTVPRCSSTNRIPKTGFYCTPATSAFASSGKYIGNAIRWMLRERSSGNQYYWSADFNPSNRVPQNYVTCEGDTDAQYPVAGTTTSNNSRWNGTSTNNYYSANNSPTRTSYVFYDGNYVAWANDPAQVTTQTRMDVVRTAAKELIDSLDGVNVGLMSYSARGSGGMVRFPISDVGANRAALKAAIDSLHSGGYTPLSETLAEAYRYFKGDAVHYGRESTSCSRDVSGTCSNSDQVSTPSVPEARTGPNLANYLSPITSACQQNYIVFLTDGLPYEDDEADAFIEGLDTGAGNRCYTSTSSMWSALGYASTPSIPNYDRSTGLCLKEAARSLKNLDLSPFTGVQSVTTYFIGFGDGVGAGAPQAYLQDAANAGGGSAEIAADAAELATAFERTIGSVLDSSSTFTSPSVAVNSFNKTQVLEDLYVAMFEPSQNTHWPGNVKKLKFRDGQIVGRGASMNSVDRVSAVDPNTGFFTRNVKDFWQQLSDDGLGNDTTAGGAANRIPPPGSRNLYTYVGNAKPSGAQALANHPLDESNSDITEGLLNIGDPSDPSRSVLINWARGDADGDTVNTTDDVRNAMGDPVHSQPAVVIYGNSGSSETEKLNDAVVYIATNDGYLHAFDVTSGTELWAYVPQELLGDLKVLYEDSITNTKHYSLDGDIRVLKYDVDGDGVVEPADNDRVFLYFSQGRGGDRYYALDVTDKDNPKYLWSLGTSDLSGIVSKSWSTPTLGRVKVANAAQNTQRLVLIFGAGYDDIEDSESFFAAGDTYGNGLFMVDAVTGAVLWSVTKTASGAFANMTHAIPSSVTVLDTNNDGWSDRMYVGDMAGQIWRFDITNGNPASSLVAGGVIASLGGKISPTIANNRSFYNPPDVAKFINPSGSNYYNIAIGSGDRALPKSNLTTEDRFYSIRDYHLGPMTQAQYNSLAAVLDDDLVEIDGETAQSFAAGSRGWKLTLGTGEKVLAPSVTVDGTVMFTSYLPGISAANACSVSAGSGRAYSVNVTTGTKRFDELYESFPVTGLPPQVAIIAPSLVVRTDGTTPDPESDPTSTAPGTCLSGVTILGNCVDFGSRVKTFWRDASAY